MVLVTLVLSGACSAEGRPGTGIDAGEGDPQDAGVPSDVARRDIGPPIDSGACAEDVHQAEMVEVDLLIVLDQSSSMGAEISEAGPTRWEAVTGAIDEFMSAPGSAGIGVGLAYFPQNDEPVGECMPCAGNTCSICVNGCCDPPAMGPCDDTCASGNCMNNLCLQVPTAVASCELDRYSTPEIEIGQLPGVRAEILESFSRHMPEGDTPTSVALQGAADYLTSWVDDHPDRSVAIVVASDGSATTCPPVEDDALAAIAADAFDSAARIQTFVIGIGNSDGEARGDATAIAVAGGTERPYVANDEETASAFLDALKDIRLRTVGCRFQIPTPRSGFEADFGRVNVVHRDGDGNETTVGSTGTLAGEGCGPQGGWHYDDPEDPSEIQLCPTTCDAVEAERESEVTIVLGCNTVLI